MNTQRTISKLSVACATAVAGVSLFPALAPAATLFSDNFNVDSSASWTVNVAPAINGSLQQATFAFDYSALGIPPAPGSGDTLGLRLRSNIPGGAAAPVTTRPAGILSGLSVSPSGQSFGTSYHLSFSAWANFNGAANAQGLADNANSEDGTHNILFAVGTSGTAPLVVGNTGLASGGAMDGIGFATTGDGGIANDYRVYPKSGVISAAGSGVYVAASLANSAPYYTTLFPPVSAPAVQLALSTAEFADALNTQAGQTQAGAFGFAWHNVDIYKDGNNITWLIDGAAIANLDVSSLGTLGGSDIALGDSDVNTTTTRHPSLLFSLFDNVLVTDVVPEPSTMALTGIGFAALLVSRRHRKN